MTQPPARDHDGRVRGRERGRALPAVWEPSARTPFAFYSTSSGGRTMKEGGSGFWRYLGARIIAVALPRLVAYEALPLQDSELQRCICCGFPTDNRCNACDDPACVQPFCSTSSVAECCDDVIWCGRDEVCTDWKCKDVTCNALICYRCYKSACNRCSDDELGKACNVHREEAQSMDLWYPGICEECGHDAWPDARDQVLCSVCAADEFDDSIYVDMQSPNCGCKRRKKDDE